MTIYNINGKEYITSVDFANRICKCTQAVNRLVRIGNPIRKLKHIKYGKQILIQKDEIVEYPFVKSGKVTNNIYSVYFYNYDGLIREEKKYNKNTKEFI